MEGTLQYLRGLEPRLDAQSSIVSNTLDGTKEFSILVQNVFQEIDGMEFRLACHHDGSLLLEKILKPANKFQIRVFWDRLAGCYKRMACHRYASHVLETLIRVSSAQKDSNDGDADLVEEGVDTGLLLGLHEMISRFEEEILCEFEDLLNDSYASHVLRVYIDSFPVSKAILASITDENKLFRRATSQTASPVLQAIFSKCAGRISVHALITDRSNWLKLAKDRIGSHTTEALIRNVLSTRSSSEYLEFYNQCFRGDTNALISSPYANFAVQSLIQSTPTVQMFRLIVSEVQGHSDMAHSRIGVLFRIIEWPLEHQSQGAESAIECLHVALGIKEVSEKQNIVSKLSHSKMGLSILNLLPRYPCTLNNHFTTSLTSLDSESLLTLCLDQTGSRIIQTALTVNTNPDTTGSTLGPKPRKNLTKALLPHVATLAVNKSASYILEAAFNGASIDAKESIVQELVKSKQKVEDSAVGRIIASKFKVEEYLRSTSDWLKKYSVDGSKKRSIMDEIFENKKSK